MLYNIWPCPSKWQDTGERKYKMFCRKHFERGRSNFVVESV